MKDTFLTNEVYNRLVAIPLEKRADLLMTIMRLTVEVTRELDANDREPVDEFLRLCAAQPAMVQ